jgi:hypothetical protein
VVGIWTNVSDKHITSTFRVEICRARNERAEGDLKMEMIRSSETSVHIRTICLYIPEDGKLRVCISLYSENQKPADLLETKRRLTLMLKLMLRKQDESAEWISSCCHPTVSSCEHINKCESSIKEVCAGISSLRRALLAALWPLLITALYGLIYLGSALKFAWIHLYRATNCCSIKLPFLW